MQGGKTSLVLSYFPAGSTPDYKEPSARPKPPSTQDLGDNLGLETYSGEFNKHLLFQC
jgi:hypothetical protein